jgi:hypothetical protein
MQKLYGERLRKDGGLTKTIKTVAGKHARKLESRAGRHAPELKRVASEVKETMVRVEERVHEAMEEFLQSGKLASRSSLDIWAKFRLSYSSSSSERGCQRYQTPYTAIKGKNDHHVGVKFIPHIRHSVLIIEMGS